MQIKKKFILTFVVLFLLQIGKAQFGYGLTVNHDLYQHFTNPKDESNTYRGAGSAILNFSAGPKIWVGSENVSLSLEAQAGIGFLTLAVKDFKGMGSANFPLMAKLNFGGLSALDKEGKLGWHIGGGLQYFRTELYGLRDKYEDLGTKRGLYPSYITQFGYGFGLSGFAVSGILKYAFNPDSKARFLSLGIQYDFNMPMLKKISTAASSL